MGASLWEESSQDEFNKLKQLSLELKFSSGPESICLRVSFLSNLFIINRNKFNLIYVLYIIMCVLLKVLKINLLLFKGKIKKIISHQRSLFINSLKESKDVHEVEANSH